MIRFLEADEKLISETVQDGDYLIMGSDIWRQGRAWFKCHRNAEKIPVRDENGKVICYAFQDMDANRELRMLEELCEEKAALHFEELYPQYDCVVIQECNELAYAFAKYLSDRGIRVKISGKYWNKIGKWEELETNGRVLTIYAEGTWEHNSNLSYELLRSVSVEFECIDDLYKENIKRGIITNAKCSYSELIKQLRNRHIILLGTGNMLQDIYDMLVAEGLDIAAFLSYGTRNGLRILGREVIGIEEIQKFDNPVFIEPGKNSALGQGHLEEYVYYGCRRNEDFFSFGDYAEVQRNNLRHILQGKRILLVGERLLSSYLKADMLSNGKEADSVQYYEEAEVDFIEEDTLGVVVVFQKFGVVGSYEKWQREINLCLQTLKEHNIEDYTLYFTMSNPFARIQNKEKYSSNELRSKGVLIGAVNAFSGNIFFRDCIDNHPNIIQFGFTPFENDMFWHCICCSQVPVEEVVSTLFDLNRHAYGEERFLRVFPDTAVFREKCESVLNGKKTVTPQELLVAFAVSYNEMKGRKISDIGQTYIYWEPHMQDVPLRLLYADWLADHETRGIAVYLSRNAMIAGGSSLKYSYRAKQKIGLMQMMAPLLGVPYILDMEKEADNRIILKFEDIKLKPKETWMRLCNEIEIPWSDTFLETTRFGEESYFYCETEKMTTGYDLRPVYRDHSDLFSPFDKMRIYFCKAEYQRKYGYPYDDTSFTRKELQELYLKDFKCQEVLEINTEKNEDQYFLAHKYIQRRLNEIYVNSFWNRLVENNG